MTTEALPQAAAPVTIVADTSVTAPVLDIVVPVYNEETDIALRLRRLHDHLRTHVPFTARITVADNASTDATVAIAAELAGELLSLIHI